MRKIDGVLGSDSFWRRKRPRILISSVGTAPVCFAGGRRTSSQGLKITEENVLPCDYIFKWLEVQVVSDKDYKPSPASSAPHGQQGTLENLHICRKD